MGGHRVKLGSLRRRVSGRVLVAAATLLAFVLFVSALGIALAPSRALASSSTLSILRGTVEVKHAGGEFQPAIDGQLVQAGDVVRTGPESGAVLIFPDGSTATLQSETEVDLAELSASASGDIVVLMRQAVGQTWHVIERSLTPNSRYRVRTPAATASVRGTLFAVDAINNVVATTRGVVGVENAFGSTAVGEEQFTTFGPAQAPAAPQPLPEGTKVTVTVAPTGASSVSVKNEQTNAALVVSSTGVRNTIIGSTHSVQPDGSVVFVLRDVTKVSVAARGDAPAASVKVEVREGGRVVAESTAATVQTTAGTSVNGFDVRTEAGRAPEIRTFTADEVRNITPPKVGQLPPGFAPSGSGGAAGAGGASAPGRGVPIGPGTQGGGQGPSGPAAPAGAPAGAPAEAPAGQPAGAPPAPQGAPAGGGAEPKQPAAPPQPPGGASGPGAGAAGGGEGGGPGAGGAGGGGGPQGQQAQPPAPSGFAPSAPSLPQLPVIGAQPPTSGQAGGRGPGGSGPSGPSGGGPGSQPAGAPLAPGSAPAQAPTGPQQGPSEPSTGGAQQPSTGGGQQPGTSGSGGGGGGSGGGDGGSSPSSPPGLAPSQPVLPPLPQPGGGSSRPGGKP